MHYLRLLTCFCGGACLLVAACYAQAPPDAKPADEAIKIVRDASYNEMHAGGDARPYRYRQQSMDGGKTSVKDVVETRDGDMSRLLSRNGEPLNAHDNEQELARLNRLRDDPDEQARQHRKSKADSDRDDEMLRLLPDAFLYTLAGMVPGPNGPCYRLLFQPNPAFQPPDRQAEVYHGMAGELWVDEAQRRMVRLDAHMIDDVNFGWGMVGRLFKGGTILVEQRDVGNHHWESTHTRLNLTGKILMVKELRINSQDDLSDFHPVPDAGYRAAIALLESTP